MRMGAVHDAVDDQAQHGASPLTALDDDLISVASFGRDARPFLTRRISERLAKLCKRGLHREEPVGESHCFRLELSPKNIISEDLHDMLCKLRPAPGTEEGFPCPSAPARFITIAHPAVCASTHLILSPVPATWGSITTRAVRHSFLRSPSL